MIGEFRLVHANRTAPHVANSRCFRFNPSYGEVTSFFPHSSFTPQLSLARLFLLPSRLAPKYKPRFPLDSATHTTLLFTYSTPNLTILLDLFLSQTPTPPALSSYTYLPAQQNIRVLLLEQTCHPTTASPLPVFAPQPNKPNSFHPATEQAQRSG